MDAQTRNYRLSQFEKTDTQEAPYLRTLKITSSGGNTHCLDITQEEYNKIKLILTAGKNLARVDNMESPRTGKPVSNQFIIQDELGNVFFQSYKSIIVKIDTHGNTTLDRDKWDYSNTTSKYRNSFLGETTKEIKAKIKSGEYLLADLN